MNSRASTRTARRVAYGWARRGERTLMEAWLTVAEQFGEVTERHRSHAERLLLESAGGRVIPGQIDIEGREAA